jgi:hypothetical protein
LKADRRELSFDDSHRNTVDLIGAARAVCRLRRLKRTRSVVGNHAGFMPLWMFERVTRGPTRTTQNLAALVSGDGNDLQRMHDRNAILSLKSPTNPAAAMSVNGEDVVRPDRASVRIRRMFITCARLILPALWRIPDDGRPRGTRRTNTGPRPAFRGWAGSDLIMSIYARTQGMAD